MYAQYAAAVKHMKTLQLCHVGSRYCLYWHVCFGKLQGGEKLKAVEDQVTRRTDTAMRVLLDMSFPEPVGPLRIYEVCSAGTLLAM